MPIQRPNAVVYQEFETLSTAADTPDLNVLVVGPCNQILDYADDKDECYAGAYGELNSNNPLVDPAAVLLSSPPNALPGIELDASSVKVFFDTARVALIEAAAAAAEYGQYSANNNLFYAHDATGGIDFIQKEIVPGDVLVAQGTGVADTVRVVKEVISTFIDTAGTSTFITNGIQPGDILTIINDVPPGTVSRNGVYNIKAVRDNNTLEVEDTGWEQYATASFTGGYTCDFTVTTSSGVIKLSASSKEMANYAEIYVTEDFTEAAPLNCRWRLERTSNDIELSDTDFSVSGNAITVAGAITVDLGPVPLANKKVTYASIYVQYVALRTDLQKLNDLNDSIEIEAVLGKYDARNPLCVGAIIAKSNTVTKIQAFGVKSDNLIGYLDFIERISSEDSVYAIVPLTYDTSILAALSAMTEQLADPNTVVSLGIKQKFRVCLGAVDLPTTKDLITARSGGTSVQVVNTAPSAIKTLTFSGFGGLDLSALGVVPGDIIQIDKASPVAVVNYTIAQLRTTLIVECDEGVATYALQASDELTIFAADGVTVKYNQVYTAAETVTASVLDNLYLEFQAANANFLTNGVIPGDIIQIPAGVSVNSWGTYGSWVVDNVMSETRLRIVNNGTNTSVLSNELPQAYSRVDGSAITAGTIYYRVVRTLSKAQQVTSMVAVASSFTNRRVVLCYPDLVDVSGLVDGSLPRTSPNTPELAASQPGYYLACVVGGQTAGQPPQQGFTNMGGSGISRIYNSSEYFTEEQLATLSNGGIYVFVQDTPNSLPYSIHEVTTDVSSIEFAEYMITKDYDFVAWTFLRAIRPYLGEWNVLDETLGFITQTLRNTGDGLRKRVVSKIGAPLTSYVINRVAVSDSTSDGVDATMNISLPMTLNQLALHLVA